MQKQMFFGSTLVLFGPGQIGETAAALARITPSREGVLLVHDPGVWLEPVVEELQQSLKEKGFPRVELFSALSPNPRLTECEEGVNRARERDCRLFIGLGGGSVIDAVKKIAREAGGEILAAIPTTAGTGSYINEWSVLLDQEDCKVSIPCRSPDLAVVDPVLTVSKPPALTLCTGADSFSHGLEAYLGHKEAEEAGKKALQGCELVVQNVEKALQDGRDLRARSKLFWADLLTGEAMRLTGLGLIHCIANILPGFYPQHPHGQICGALMTNATRYNLPAVDGIKGEKMSPLLEQMDALFYRYEQSLEILPIKIRAEDVCRIKEYAVTNCNAANNPRPVTEEVVEYVLGQSFPVEQG